MTHYLDNIKLYAKYGKRGCCGFCACENTARWMTWLFSEQLYRHSNPTKKEVLDWLWDIKYDESGNISQIITGSRPWYRHKNLLRLSSTLTYKEFEAYIINHFNKYNYLGIATETNIDTLNHAFVLFKFDLDNFYLVDSYIGQHYEIIVRPCKLHQFKKIIENKNIIDWNTVFEVNIDLDTSIE